MIVDPGFYIHGDSIVPREEIIEIEDIELPKFLVEKVVEKKKKTMRKTTPKPVKLTIVP